MVRERTGEQRVRLPVAVGAALARASQPTIAFRVALGRMAAATRFGSGR